MRTAEEMLITLFKPTYQDCTTISEDLQLAITLNPSLDLIKKAINQARIDAIKECAEKAKIKRQNPYEYATALAGGSECMVDKQSILSLIPLVK